MKERRRSRIGFSFIAIATLAFTNTAVLGCSPGEDYKGPETNFELVQQADTIFVGTLVKSVSGDISNRKILVKPTLLLKGPDLPKGIYIRGFLADELLRMPDTDIQLQLRAIKSQPLDLWRPHPEVWIGGCSRQTFAKGMRVVLFFQRAKGKLVEFGPAFTRSSEDVPSLDALWVQTVKLYARIGQLPLAEQKPALRAEMLKLRGDSSLNRENALLADDIERQLAGVGPVSDFGHGRSTSDETRWLHNIVDTMYHAQVPSLKEVAVVRQSGTPSKLPWIVAGSLIVSVLFVMSILLCCKKRKTT